MGKDDRIYQGSDDVESSLTEAFGYSDDQLADEYDRAESAGRPAHMPPAPKWEFEKILERVKKKTDAPESRE